LHDGALAEYDVEVGRDGICTAHLSKYKGNPAHTPPEEVRLKKEGRHWVGDTDNRHFADELGYAVEIKAKPLLESRNRSSGHPAE
jgi:sugar lactone lactonase YvrE